MGIIKPLRRTVEVRQRERFNRPFRGNPDADILIVCDPPTHQAYKSALPMSVAGLKKFAEHAFAAGFTSTDFYFVGLCAPIPEEDKDSDSRKWKRVEPHLDSLHRIIQQRNPKLVVPFGKEATRAVVGKSLAITKARGKAIHVRDRLVLPFLSPNMVLYVPDHEPTFSADCETLARIREDNYEVSEQVDQNVNYQWREDISDILAAKPPIIGLDTETTGLRHHDPDVRVLTVQIATEVGHAVVVPVCKEYWPAWEGRERSHSRVVAQLKALLEDPSVKKVGHNLKFDIHMLRKLGIELQGWEDDTQVKAFAVDENMMEKSLDECVRRWVPEMAGYADSFNETVDKSRMQDVPHDLMLPYAAGDPDASLRLNRNLDRILSRDMEQERCYRLVQMPALRSFARNIERHGMLIDQQRLREFGVEVSTHLVDAYDSLIRRVPAAVRRLHAEQGKELVFSRPDFVRDTLFTPEGLGLEPMVFTKGTRRLSPDQQIASTSAKDHLPWFADPATPNGQFVLDLIDYQKTRTLNNNFIGNQNEGNGLWQYIAPDGRIYPSYMLHRAVTGRTASADPNGQNFPKRGRWAKAYQSIFIPTPGFKMVNCDLSQIELRIAAWMAGDENMLDIYRRDGDIHAATGQYVAGLSDSQWEALAPAERKGFRQRAKAVNFGFLYGMFAKKFRAFAKTDYGVDYTERESEEARARFFSLYRQLEPWHEAMRRTVRAEGQVRALHGAVRHLPSINSNDKMIQMSAERQAINSPVQRFASDMGIMAMSRFSAQADPDLFRIVGFVHDALVMEVRDGYEAEGIQALLYAMESNPLQEAFGLVPPLPIKADAEIGLNNGSMLELADLPPVDERPDWFNELGFEKLNPSRPDWWEDAIEQEWLAGTS